MEIEIKTKTKIKVTHLLIKAGVRYWEDATVNGVEDETGNLIPCRNGDYWQPTVDIETGQIINWEKGKEADIHYKVCDDGDYWLLSPSGEMVVKYKGDYVPDILAINDDGYGDYIIITVDQDGFIKDWNFKTKGFSKKV